MAHLKQEDLIRIWILLGSEIRKWANDVELLRQVSEENAWFQAEQTQKALHALGMMLQPEPLGKWLGHYPLLPKQTDKTVGLVMAGNLPMVGFHDWLCVLSAGYRLQVKLSSQDRVLFHRLHEFIGEIAPILRERIEVVEQIQRPDAIIATGSDNTSRYFDYYFRSYPNIIRKNRNAIALLHGKESQEELTALGRDIFDYYGLGCRNVSFLMVPENYDWQPFWSAMEAYQATGGFYKYRNNYDYQKAILLVNREAHMDNGFVLLKPHDRIASAIGVLHYKTYSSVSEVEGFIQQHQEKIQCIVTSLALPFRTFPFGQAQCPSLMDYADGVDVMDFLSGL